MKLILHIGEYALGGCGGMGGGENTSNGPSVVVMDKMLEYANVPHYARNKWDI